MKTLGAEDLVAGGVSLVLSNERDASRLLQLLRLKMLESMEKVRLPMYYTD